MEYVRVGGSSLKVSRLILGAMAIGDPAWRSWVLSEDAARPIIARALEHGINTFDTCNFYSLGVGEEVLGRVLKELVPREEVVIATKVGGPLGKEPNGRGYSRKNIMASVDDSLRRLGVDYIDLYQTHIWERATDLEEMMCAFDDLIRSGKVLYVGAADMPAWQFVKANSIAERHGWSRFISLQHHYNLIFRDDEREHIPYCVAEDIGLLPYSPMARGFLCDAQRYDHGGSTERARTDDYALKWYDRESDRAMVRQLGSMAAEIGAKPAQVALAWVLARPGVTAPVFGATEPCHVDDAVAAMDLRLHDDQIAALDAGYEPRAI
jgi:aryl-alcohol dehydrogenase-like predicted oxidoreductase